MPLASISYTAANVRPSAGAKIESCIADVAVVAGNLVYQSATPLPGDLAPVALLDCTNATKAPLKGICLHAAAAGQRVHVVKADPALNLGSTDIAVGVIAIANPDVPGQITISTTPVSGTYRVLLGIGVAAGILNFSPVLAAVPQP